MPDSREITRCNRFLMKLRSVRNIRSGSVRNWRKRPSLLEESEEKYRLLYETSMDAILLTSPDGSIQAANPAACAMFQRTEEEIIRNGRSRAYRY